MKHLFQNQLSFDVIINTLTNTAQLSNATLYLSQNYQHLQD